MKIRVALCILMLLPLVRASAAPIEIQLDPGSYVMLYFNTPGDPSELTPVADFKHALARFSKESATMVIDLKLGGESPKLHMDRWLDRYEKYPSRGVYKLENNKGYHFGEGSYLGRVVFRRKDGVTIITQKFSDTTGKRDNELVIAITNNQEWFVKNIKIPASYVAWSWTFFECFDYLDLSYLDDLESDSESGIVDPTKQSEPTKQQSK